MVTAPCSAASTPHADNDQNSDDFMLRPSDGVDHPCRGTGIGGWKQSGVHRWPDLIWVWSRIACTARPHPMPRTAIPTPV